MTPPIDPILLEIGPFAVHWYGILVVTGILLGAQVASYLAERAGRDPEMVWDMLLIAVVGGIIGARIEYVVTPPHWGYYRENLAQAFYIWEGGLRIYGAIVGGGLGVVLYAVISKVNPLVLLDFGAPGMAIGHAIGRWGNFINYELYGPPTEFSWGLQIPPQYRVPPYHDLATYPPDTLFHPAFLYESLANLALCVGLILISERFRNELKPGSVTVAYLIGYSIIRFLMDTMRTDGTNAQPVAVVFIVLGLAYFLIQYGPWRRQTAATS